MNLFELKSELNQITEKLDRGTGYWTKEEVQRDERKRQSLIKQIKELESN